MSAISFLVRLQPTTVALTCISMLAAHSHPIAALVGSFAMAILLPWTAALCAAWGVCTETVPRHAAFWCMVSALVIYIGLSFIGGDAARNLIRVAQLALIVGVVYVSFQWTTRANQRQHRAVFRIGTAAIVVLLTATILSKLGFEQSGMANPNGLSVTALSLLGMTVYFGLHAGARKRTLYVVAAAAVGLILVSASRTVLLAALVSGMAALCIRATRRMPFLSVPLLMCALSPFLALSYLTLYPDGDVASWLNALSQDLFDKRFSSGRGDMWSAIIPHIEWWVGAGPGSAPSELTEQDLSAHNWYLQSLYQVGVIGTLPVVAAILSLWLRGAYEKSGASNWFAAFVVAVLSVQFFEVTLTQNYLAAGLAFWVAAGVEIRKARRTQCTATSPGRAARPNAAKD